ncbi:hypothetical protein B0O99DRAFT_599851 [Bisporella sp. PMI_857]|nr:hypothetical protein B0O99DRAFT_599851 [Bisporella sp. PMI_857]
MCDNKLNGVSGRCIRKVILAEKPLLQQRQKWVSDHLWEEIEGLCSYCRKIFLDEEIGGSGSMQITEAGPKYPGYITGKPYDPWGNYPSLYKDEKVIISVHGGWVTKPSPKTIQQDFGLTDADFKKMVTITTNFVQKCVDEDKNVLKNETGKFQIWWSGIGETKKTQFERDLATQGINEGVIQFWTKGKQNIKKFGFNRHCRVNREDDRLRRYPTAKWFLDYVSNTNSRMLRRKEVSTTKGKIPLFEESRSALEQISMPFYETYNTDNQTASNAQPLQIQTQQKAPTQISFESRSILGKHADFINGFHEENNRGPRRPKSPPGLPGYYSGGTMGVEHSGHNVIQTSYQAFLLAQFESQDTAPSDNLMEHATYASLYNVSDQQQQQESYESTQAASSGYIHNKQFMQ